MTDGQVAAKPIVITVFNQKGGVGKTTTSVNLAVCLAALGRRVVLVDLDSQSNATTSMGLTAPVPTGAYHLITGRASCSECLKPTPYDNLRLIAGSDELAWADIELALQDDCQLAIQRAFERLPSDVEIVVIDCPPAPGIVSVNALVAADAVVMPVMPSPHALDGLHKAWWNVNRVRGHFNHDLHTVYILLTMTEDGEMTGRLTEDIIAEFGARVVPVLIPRDPVVIEAAARDLPVVTMAPQSPPARAYLRLAELLLNRVSRMAALAEGDEGAGSADRDFGADRLAEWAGAVAQNGQGRRAVPEPGDPPAPGWTEDIPAGLPLTMAPGWGWKLAVAAALVLLGVVMGLAAGLTIHNWSLVPIPV
ncbi:MAG: ParA family protein [Alphaproteobacteria bacterium]|nr:ParA family protein [Alphaproteobacteria bacterium]